MAIKSLESTYIYSNLNKANGLTTNIASLLSEGFNVTKEQIEEPLMIINKNFKYPLKHEVLNDFEEGKIIIRCGTKSRIPTCMPFFLTKLGGQVVAIVVGDIYGTFDEETNTLKIDPKKLYCIMEAAFLAKVIYFNSDRVATTSEIFARGSSIYSAMFTRVLNKKYALNVDKTKMHKVLMLSSKFFMINIMGAKDGDMVFNYAIKNCSNGNIYSLKEADAAVKPEAYNNIESFINELANNKALGLNFKGLTVRGFIESYMNMYDASALLALESFPYFVYAVNCVINGAYINNQYILEDLVGNDGAKLYTALSKFVMK